MTRCSLGALALALSLATSAAARGPDDLLALERSRSAAIVSKDMPALDRIYADDFRGVASQGAVIGKTALLAVFERADASTVFEVDELDAREFGDTAVTTGRLTARTAASDVLSRSRFTHVYVRRDGAWRLVAGQSTPVVESPSR